MSQYIILEQRSANLNEFDVGDQKHENDHRLSSTLHHRILSYADDENLRVLQLSQNKPILNNKICYVNFKLMFMGKFRNYSMVSDDAPIETPNQQNNVLLNC